jgi:mono/diheme cytochrome c family protein
MRVLLFLLASAAALGLAFADAGDAAKRGEKLFRERPEDGLYASCADCHSLLPDAEEAKAEHRGPGATLFGAAVREGWRNMNTFKDVGEASQKCAKAWQKREGGLGAGQRADLVAFLRKHGPEGALPKREVQRQPKLAKEFGAGDPELGKRLAATWCMACHNEAEDALSFPFEPGKRKRDQVARAVRGYDAKGAFKPEERSMSYFTNDRLPDEDLKHILAYIGK